MDPQEKTVVPLNVVLPLKSGDILNIMMATETMDEGLGVETNSHWRTYNSKYNRNNSTVG